MNWKFHDAATEAVVGICLGLLIGMALASLDWAKIGALFQ